MYRRILMNRNLKFTNFMRNQLFGDLKELNAAFITPTHEVKCTLSLNAFGEPELEYKNKWFDCNHERKGDLSIIDWFTSCYEIHYETKKITNKRIALIVERPIHNGDESGSGVLIPTLMVYVFNIPKKDNIFDTIIDGLFGGTIKPVFRETDINKFNVTYHVSATKETAETYENICTYSFDELEDELGDIDSDIIAEKDNIILSYNKVTKLAITSSEAIHDIHKVFYLEDPDNLDDLMEKVCNEPSSEIDGYICTYEYNDYSWYHSIINKNDEYIKIVDQKNYSFVCEYPAGKITCSHTDFIPGFVMEFKQGDDVVLFSDIVVTNDGLFTSKNTTFKANIIDYKPRKKSAIVGYDGFFTNNKMTIIRDPFYRAIMVETN